MGSFDASKEGTVGVDNAVMSVAVNNLDEIKQQFTTWNGQLVDLRDLVIADWFGGAAEQFTGSYEALAEAMTLMIDCAMALRNFSQDAMDLYTRGDEAVADTVYTALKTGLG